MMRPMEPIDHLDLVVSDLDRSVRFYAGLLRPFGYADSGPITGERGERVIYIERPTGTGAIGLRERQSKSGDVDRYALGMHHLAFKATSREMVDERAEWLRRNGVELESEPREYDYSPGYYAVFFFDPDGLKLEIVHRPEREVA